MIVDRLAIRNGIEKRLSDSLEVAFKYGQDLLKIERLKDKGEAGEPTSASASRASNAASRIPR